MEKQIKNNKTSVKEIMWMAVALLCLYIAIKINIERGFQQSILYYLCMIAAALMFLLRRYMRLQAIKKNNDNT